MDSAKYSIKASSHIINLLGDELIGSDSLALFEIVKNSYDADSPDVIVSFNDLRASNATIIIEDHGAGMTPEVINNAWLTLGTDYKRKALKESPIYHRISLGNKGVGRLAVHRLANEITLYTQPIGSIYGSRLHINWNQLINSSDFINGMDVDVDNNLPNILPNGHGTKIILSDLREKNWTRVKVGEMVTKLNSIINPFSLQNNFKIIIKSNDSIVQDWINSVKSPQEILKDSLYKFTFSLYKNPDDIGDNATFKWTYNFRPSTISKSIVIKDNAISKVDVLQISSNLFSFLGNKYKDQNLLKNHELEGIEFIEGEFYAFNMNSKILNSIYGYGSIGKIKEFMVNYCGVRVFRDNIRVYNYGEPTDDWLGLDQARMKRLSSHFAKGQTVGAINLRLKDTRNTLREKTNREGFIENDYFNMLVAIVQSVFGHFERISQSDRDSIKAYIDSTVVQKRVGFSDTIEELENKLQKRGLLNEYGGLVKKVKHDYDNMRDVMLNSGINGLNLTIVFHEVEREMGFISHDISKKNYDIDNIRLRIRSLMDLMEKFMPLLKKNRTSNISASTLAKRAITIHQNRFLFHSIQTEFPLLSDRSLDFNIKGPGGLLMGALSNILDNAIYWVNIKREKDGFNYTPKILVTSDQSNFSGPAIIIADNGDGFQLPPEDSILPFRTLKPNGMGVGLYYVSLVMELINGKLLFPNISYIGLPQEYSGACIALVFSNQ